MKKKYFNTLMFKSSAVVTINGRNKSVDLVEKKS